MKQSETLYELFKDVDQQNMMIKLTEGDKGLYLDNPVKACGPTVDFPEPWIIEKFPSTNICSIISVGGEIEETVISMIPLDMAKKVIEELEDD